MIRNTFSMLPGSGERLEKRLWRNGIVTWQDFLDIEEIQYIGRHKKSFFDGSLSSAQQELSNANACYFASSIKRREHWRLFEEFKGEAAYLDIETNGRMPGSGGDGTPIGIYVRCDYKCFVQD